MSCLSWRGIFHKNWEIKLKFQMGGLWRNRGPPSFFSRKGALTHHPKGQWYFLRKTCALRGGCGCCGQPPDNATAPASAAVIVCAGLSCFRFGNSLRPARTNLPLAALFAAMTRSSTSGHFLFCERETEKRKNEVNKRRRFIIWKRRWSAGAQVALPWPLLLI